MDGQVHLLTEDTYNFLGHAVAVRSNSPVVRDHLRSVYGNFLRATTAPPGTGRERETPPHVITVLDEIAATQELHLSDAFQSYHLRCTDVYTFDFTYYRSSTVPDPLTYVQWMVLTSVALLARDFHFFHAGSVAWRGHAMIFPALSGRGKTTLTLKLATHGFQFLSDEVACVRYNDHIVEPFPRRLNLSEDSRKLLGFPEWPTAGVRTLRTREWVLDISTVAPGSRGAPCPLRWVIFLEGFGLAPNLEVLGTSDALRSLLSFSLRPVQDPAALLFQLASVFPAARCYKLTVGPVDETAELLLRLVTQDIGDSS
jgi:hypothetical protein